MLVTSLANSQIKAIRRLRNRKERQESGLFYLEGLRIVGEAIQQGAKIETLVVAPELLVSEFGQKLVEEQARRGMPILEVSAQVFKGLALKEGPQGIAAVAYQRWTPLSGVNLCEGKTWVALDAVADPGNLGTILRTHDATGGRGVILLDQATDPFEPTSVRASMGAIFSQVLVKSTLAEFKEFQQRVNVPVIGASGNAQADYHHVRYPNELILLMGSERQGLSKHHLQLCDELVRIPMIGRSDSLNLAVATALILYEIFNQRRDAESM